MSDAIFIDNISKTYRVPSIFPWRRTKKTEALKDVTLSCPERKITCLLGPNGAGKTTIIKILAGLVLPDSGKIEILNTPLSSMNKMEQINIGLATPNERSFYWRITGRQNLDFYGSLYGLKGKTRKQKVSEILFEVDMDKEADKPFRLYSAGMRQKLLLARALLSDPDILLLDEPTTHIDPIAQESIHKLIIKDFIEKRKTTVLLCTHDLAEAQKLADKIILLDKGRVIADGSLSSLRSMINPSLKIKIKFSKIPFNGWESNLPVKILDQNDYQIELSVPDEKVISQAIDAAVSGGGKILSCIPYEESLLEIFTRLTEGDVS